MRSPVAGACRDHDSCLENTSAGSTKTKTARVELIIHMTCYPMDTLSLSSWLGQVCGPLFVNALKVELRTPGMGGGRRVLQVLYSGANRSCTF